MRMRRYGFTLVELLVVIAIIGKLMAGTICHADLVVDHSVIRLDQCPVSEESCQWAEGWGEIRQFYPRYFKPSATIHVFVRNDGAKPLTIERLSLNGKSIEQIATKADFAGDVIWYRSNPETLKPGETGIVYIRLRCRPEAPVDVGVQSTDGQTTSVRLTQNHHEQIRLGHVGFNKQIDKVYVYVDKITDSPLHLKGIFIDGRDVTDESEIINSDFAQGPALVEIRLSKPWSYGAYHCIKVTTREGLSAMHQVRARNDRFLIGMVGGQVREYYAKFFNMLYSLGGTFPKKPGWWNSQGELAQLGFSQLQPAPSDEAIAAGASVPPGRILYGAADEPDAHEPAGLEYMQRCGINIMRKLEPIMRRQRRGDPHHETAAMIDRTYAPLNWFTYGEVPDLLFNDIYSPTKWHGFDLGGFAPTVDTLLSAAGPRPVHVMLWGGFNTGYSAKRSVTPEENDMSVHYVIGSGAKGLHYFLDWDSYPSVFEGGYFVGAPRTNMLWKNMGRMNAEITRLGTLLSIGHPFNVVSADTPSLWARSLLCGKDNLIVVLVNRKHRILYDPRTRLPHIYPLKDATVTIDLPAWFDAKTAVHVAHDAVRPVKLTGQGRTRKLQIETIKTSMVLLLSQNAEVAQTLKLDPTQYAAMLESEKPVYVTDGPVIEDVDRPESVVRIDEKMLKAGQITFDLTDPSTLAKARRIYTTGQLRLEPGKWLGLFTPRDWHGCSEIVFVVESESPLKEVKAALLSSTPNFAACANNVVGLSLDGRKYQEDCSFKMRWNGGRSGEILSASAASTDDKFIHRFFVRILLRDPGIVHSDDATNLAQKLTLSWKKPATAGN